MSRVATTWEAVEHNGKIIGWVQNDPQFGWTAVTKEGRGVPVRFGASHDDCVAELHRRDAAQAGEGSDEHGA